MNGLAKGYADNIDGVYLFSKISRRVADYKLKNPNSDLIRLDIGDVTMPLPYAVADAMAKASYEMASTSTFRGYGEEQGYRFLREAVAMYYSRNTGYLPDIGEIFISDGAKSDIANFQELFPLCAKAVIQDPVYPVYRESNLLCGRQIVYLDGTRSNGFLPMPDAFPNGSIVYICSPDNPTGATYNRVQLARLIDMAMASGSVILYDSAYEAFVEDIDVPRSVYEIDGATECAVEFCSLSKTAGFTGVRCGYTVVPYGLKVGGYSLNKAWQKSRSTKFNGVPYIVQRGAQKALSEECADSLKNRIVYYKDNAKAIARSFTLAGYTCYGARNSPYVFIDIGVDDVEFFDRLLDEQGVTVTPGSGFGRNGKNFVRLTGFNTKNNTTEALTRIRRLLK